MTWKHQHLIFHIIFPWYYHHLLQKISRVSLFISGAMWRDINEGKIIGLERIMTGTDRR